MEITETWESLNILCKITHKIWTSAKQKSELIEVNISPILAIRKKRYCKVENFKLKKQEFFEDVKAVGLTHSRGVAGAMSCEEIMFHSKGLAILRKG